MTTLFFFILLSAELTKSDKEDGRKTYIEIWRRRLTGTYEAQGSCKECCR